MDITTLILQVYAGLTFSIGVSLLLRRDLLMDVRELIEDSRFSVMLGIISLGFGWIIIFGIKPDDIKSAIVYIMGIAALLKGFTRLISPGHEVKYLNYMERREKQLGILLLIISVIFFSIAYL